MLRSEDFDSYHQFVLAMIAKALLVPADQLTIGELHSFHEIRQKLGHVGLVFHDEVDDYPEAEPIHPIVSRYFGPRVSDVAVHSRAILHTAWARSCVDRELAFHEHLLKTRGGA